MTKPLSKTDLTRAAWLTELRRQGHRQCLGELFLGDGLKVCALGLLAEVAGLTLRDAEEIANEEGYDPIGALAGLTPASTDIVWSLNDRKRLTFAEIADVVEAWFPNPGGSM